MTNEQRHHSQKIINNQRLRRNAKVREKRLLKLSESGHCQVIYW